MDFAVSASGDVAAVDPGSTVAVVIEVENRSETAQEFEIRVEGLDPGWVAVPVATFTVEPGGRTAERVILRPPRVSESLAGTYPYVATVRSLVTGESSPVQGVLEVRPFYNLSAEIQPRRATVSPFQREASLSVKLLNLGNTPQAVQMFAADSDATLAFEFESDQVTVMPGQERTVSFTTAASRTPLFASSRLQNYTVSARNIEHPAVGATSTGQIEHRALLAPSALFFLLFLLLLGAAWVASWPPTPVVEAVTVSPERATVGEPVTVRWNTSGTKSVSLRIGEWAKTRQAPSGSVEFVPDKEGTFEVVVTAYQGRRTAVDRSKSLTVVAKAVSPDPKVRIWLENETVPAGQTYLLKYECNEAVVKATLFPMQRDLDPRADGIELTATSPGRMELRVVASNADGKTVEASVTLNVVERPEASIVKFTAFPKELPEGGGEVTIEWTVSKASRIELVYDSRTVVQEMATGTYSVTVTADTAFKLVAYDAQGRTVTSETVRVKVARPPQPPADPLPDTRGDG